MRPGTKALIRKNGPKHGWSHESWTRSTNWKSPELLHRPGIPKWAAWNVGPGSDATTDPRKAIQAGTAHPVG